ncbi:hypothetical protein [Nitrospira moscoviensis]|uniref:IPT/TIG domain-containing protein n=1 Tax=Nitrospira moscoviensis TaxID=42253 RepID=A0A0K2GFF2_NITMO|nr:hypothetical protein [Nitrospira moscoviensis]ALA59681.1 exported protein of unknown function [Nitrospira moscoviensis]
MIVRHESSWTGGLSGLALVLLAGFTLPRAAWAAAPPIVLEPAQAAPGATVTLSGTGFGQAGPFTIEPKGLPDAAYWTNNRPDASTNQ